MKRREGLSRRRRRPPSFLRRRDNPSFHNRAEYKMDPVADAAAAHGSNLGGGEGRIAPGKWPTSHWFEGARRVGIIDLHDRVREGGFIIRSVSAPRPSTVAIDIVGNVRPVANVDEREDPEKSERDAAGPNRAGAGPLRRVRVGLRW